MHCLDCHYDLTNLSEHRCPECGRAFDPGDPDSFESDSLSAFFPTTLFWILLTLSYLGLWLAGLVPIDRDWPIVAQLFGAALTAIFPCALTALGILALCLVIAQWQASANR
jgi:hypothetical protein